MPRPSAELLNVDLDIESRWDLAPIIDALGEKVIVMHSGKIRGRHRASLELAGPLSLERNDPTPDKGILALSRLIERLPPVARRGWDRASLRRFDVGIQGGRGPAPGIFVAPLRAATIKRVADLNGEITLTIYPVDPGAPRARPPVRNS